MNVDQLSTQVKPNASRLAFKIGSQHPDGLSFGPPTPQETRHGDYRGTTADDSA